MGSDFRFPKEYARVGECLALKRSYAKPGKGELWDTGKARTEYEGEVWNAARLSYHLNISPIPRSPADPKDGLVLHSCDHGWCIEPIHLSLGTAKKNMEERSERCLDLKERMSAGQAKRWSRPEERAKMGDASRGKKMSEDTKAKMSESAKAAWSKRKQQQ